MLFALLVLAAPPLYGTWSAVRADDDRGFDDDRDDDRSERSSSGSRESRDNPEAPQVQDRPQSREQGLDVDYDRNEILVLVASPQQLAALQKEGYQIIEQRKVEHLGQTLVRFRLPRGETVQAALGKIKASGIGATSDRNHFYRTNADTCKGPRCDALSLTDWPTAGVSCRNTVTIGMIDTQVDAKHASLANQSVEVLVVRSADREASNPKHGTAVASVMVGATGSVAPGLVPNATLIAVDAFHRVDGTQDRMDAFDLIAAIDMLLKRGASVINFSFAGPSNTILARSLSQVHRRGVITVAAVGNEGPHAPPRYPAAHPEVIAVTGVDKKLQVYRRAGRGNHVMIAAPGVDVWAAEAVAGSAGKASAMSGTSFAAPHVTAAIAVLRAHSSNATPAVIVQTLLKATKDIGIPGIDPVFGHGLLQVSRLCR